MPDAALAAVILVAVGAVAWFTDGFGLRTRPDVTITPAGVTVFAPAGAADNPDKADLVIDGIIEADALREELLKRLEFARGRERHFSTRASIDASAAPE